MFMFSLTIKYTKRQNANNIYRHTLPAYLRFFHNLLFFNNELSYKIHNSSLIYELIKNSLVQLELGF